MIIDVSFIIEFISSLSFLFYLILGCFAGFTAGFLGIGGGIVAVPGLLWIFNHYHIPEHAEMQTAVATSLACILFTSIVNLYHANRRDMVDWKLWRNLLLGLLIGASLGSLIGSKLHTDTLRILFASFLLVLCLYMRFFKAVNLHINQPKTVLLNVLTLCVGVTSSLFGISGSLILTPIFSSWRIPMHKACGTSIACGPAVALMGLIGYAIHAGDMTQSSNASELANMPIGVTGYIYWPAAFSVALTSMIFVSIGSKIASYTSEQTLRNIFSLFLLLTSLHVYFYDPLIG